MGNGKTKVAILGGGMGALSAAWELLQQGPDRFDITVYQRGSRLGGKGASGRNMEAGKGRRIEEHGLHILMGFYDNAFHVLKNCYDALSGAAGAWEGALIGEAHLQLPDYYANGDCVFWPLRFPSDPTKLPGQRLPDELPDTLTLFADALRLFLRLKSDSDALNPVPNGAPPQPPQPNMDELLAMQSALPAPPAPASAPILATTIRLVVDLLFARVTQPEARDEASVKRRRHAMAGYFAGANLIGIIKNGLWKREDYLRAAPALDELDYKAWLRAQCEPPNALPQLSWDSPLVNALYDLIFSRCGDCPGGDPGFAAGTALYDCLLVVTYYWGHVFYRMNGGMGDVVFAPLYLYLKDRVTFRFFHTAKELTVSDGMIDSIVVESAWDGAYDPLFDCGGRLCWKQPLPGDPPPNQQEPIERRLVLGTDFDLVVLGISVGGLRDQRLTGAIRAANPAFEAMVDGIRTVATQAVQLWFGTDAAGLGWPFRQAMVGSFRRPFDAWADMSQVLPHERWGNDQVAVRSVAYLCDVYTGPAENADRHVRDEALTWLAGPGKELWPNFQWNLLAGSTASGQTRFDDQYWRANVDPSDGYVLAAPGTSKFRLAADNSGIANLYLAGDWTKTDLNAGCLEAATMSGRAAGRAIAKRLPKNAPQQGSYLDQDSDWVLKHPVRITGADATTLVLPGGAKAGDFCRTMVETMSGGAFTAEPLSLLGITPLLMLCASLPNVASGDPEHSQLGYFSETDVGFFIPVILERVADQQRTRAFACPYLFVDSTIGLSAGREIFGLPKAYAKIRLHSADDSGPFTLGATGDVLHADVPLPSKVQQAAIIGVSQVGEVDEAATTAANALLDALKAWLWPDGAGPVFKVPLLFGKQIRDAVHAPAACYRALLRSDLEVSNVSLVEAMFKPFTVFLPDYRKPRIAAQLGIATQIQTPIAFRAHFDLTFPEAQLLARTP